MTFRLLRFYIIVHLLYHPIASCPPRQLVHLSVQEYTSIFSPADVVSVRTTIICIITCIKRTRTVTLAVHDPTDGACACLRQNVTSVERSAITKQVYVVDLDRPGESCRYVLLVICHEVF